MDLSVRLGRLTLKNPVMPSSGTFGYGREFAELIDLNELGAVIVKGTTLHPKIGNPEHRFAEISGCGYLSCVGLQNIGVERLIDEKLPFLRELITPVIVNIACESIVEFVKVTERLTGTEGVSGIEVNLCCPNVACGGVAFASSAKMTYDVVRAVRMATGLTLIAKVSPTATDIVTIGKACEEAGADAVCSTFTAMGIAIDIETRRSKLGKNLMGALGGPFRKAIGVRLAWQLAQALKIPVIGIGGIACAEDAMEYFIAGATAVEIGTQNLIDPQATIKTIEGMKEYLSRHGMASMKEVIGTLITS